MKNRERALHGVWRTQKYFPLRKPLSQDFQLMVSAGLLVSKFKVNFKTIRNGISNFTQNGSKHWKPFKDRDAVLIDYESIPVNTLTKAKLPSDPKQAYELLRSEQLNAEDIGEELEIRNFHSALEDVYHNKWPHFQKYYEAISETPKRIQYAKTHAMIDFIISSHRDKWPTVVIFSAYQKLIRNELDSLQEPRLCTESRIYFWRVIRHCKRQGIAETIVHNSLGVPREYKTKMTGQIKAFIRLQFRSQKNLLISEIISRVYKKYNVELSASSIKSIKRDTETRNVLDFDAQGNIWSRQNGLPKLTRFLAEGPGEIYQGDYYKLQFICKNAAGKIVRLWAFVVLDVFSKKMVGWAISESRSATLAKNAFKMAFVDNCFLPEEIVVDNDTLFKRPVFKRFVERVQNLGVIWTKAFPNVPTWKAEIEGSFAVLQKLHAAKEWYIGESVKSKNTEGNPAKEYVSKLYQKKSSMLSVSEMTREFGKMIEEYNSGTGSLKKKVWPSDYFKMYESKRTKPFEKWMESLLFWKVKTRKRIKNDGRIDLEIDTVRYTYQLTHPEQFWKYKNTDVRLCYNPQDLMKIHIFERKTLKFIGEVEQRMVMERDNKKEVKAKHQKVLRDANKYVRDRRKADEALVSGIVGVNRKNETLDDKILKRQMRREQHIREVEKIPVDR